MLPSPLDVSRLEFLLASAALRLVGLVASMLPIVPDRVVLASPRHARLEGNLLAIHEAFARLRPEIRPVILVEPYGYGFGEKLAYLARLVRGMYHLRRARLFIVDNAYLPVHVGPHRAGTTVVQVWHAVSAVKRFGLDTATPPAEPERTFLHRGYDAVVVSAEAVRPTYAAALRTPVERCLALGTPRTDLFFDAPAMAAARSRLVAAHPVLNGRRVVLYAPTFRGRARDRDPGVRLDARRLRSLLPPEWVLALKTHPNVAADGLDTAGYDLVVPRHEDLNDLLVLADVLVTDYSSAIFEFALLRRPIVLLLDDLEAYRKDPGLAVDERELVGTRAVDTDGVAAAVLAGSVDAAAHAAFIERHLGACDGHSSDRFVERFGSLLG